ncbi:germination protein YpeB [Bacillus massiliigorillae]|uniref:germination protein YpeB n=1 Tax=Bacillus massiliigorillae TaxID=1243664 RepID=UPI00039C1384|nr:germination protein YpeB [Bacillus massiliigorillae]
MVRGILIAVLVVVCAGTAFWGYQEHKEKNAILVQAENNYQRAFHDLNYQMDLLNDKIGTTLAMNSRKSLSPALTDVWRITSEAQSDVGTLPLSLVPFNKTEEFLSQIGDFTYRTAVRDLEKEPLSDEEYKLLQRLYEQSGDIQQELRKVQHLVMKNNLRWMDVEMALASGKEASDNTIIDGFQTVEKKVSGYSEASQFGPTHVSNKQKDERFRNIKGKEISKEEAIEIARKFVPFGKDAKVTIEESRKGSDFKFYSVTLSDPKSNTQLDLDLTKVVGYPIIFMNNRKVGEAKISLNEASEKAMEFLKKQNYTSMELFESTQYDSVGVFNFVYVENGIRVYSDSIKVKVALDNGGIIGYSAEEYLQTNKKRELLKPKIPLEQAKKKLSPKLKIMEDRLAIITNDLGKEVLCYEFMGTMNDDTYRIFINAMTNDEELVEKMDEHESSYEDMI